MAKSKRRIQTKKFEANYDTRRWKFNDLELYFMKRSG